MVGKCTVWTCIWYQYQYLWPRGLKRGSASSRLLGMRVRIPPVARIFARVIVVFCQVDVSASGWSLVQRSPTECGVSECDREAWVKRRPWPTWGCYTTEGKKKLQTLIARSPNCVVVWNGRSKPTTWTSPHLPSCPHLTPKLLTFSSLLYWFVIPPTSHHHAD